MPADRPCVALLGLGLWSCAGPTGPGPQGASGGTDSGDPTVFLARLASFSPLPAPPPDPTNAVADDPGAALLGQRLFFDPRLSGSGEFSCATCHLPDQGFADRLAFSEANGQPERHTPTVLNSAHFKWFFWDGRADSQWSQALGPIEAAGEQDGSRLAVAHLLVSDATLAGEYVAVFGDLPDLSDAQRFPPQGRPDASDPAGPLNQAWTGMDPADQHTINQVFSNAGKAIAAYERRLVRGQAPFDVYVQGLLSGDAQAQTALDAQAIAGLDLFMDEGACFFCHSGPNFSNGEFHNIGLRTEAGQAPDDLGRYNGISALWADPFNGGGAYSDDPSAGAAKIDFLVQTEEQLGQFKVPSLRNLGDTPPYMKAGQFETLTEVVQYYSALDQAPMFGHREDLMVELDWDDEQIAQVVAFLESLDGAPLDPSLLQAP